MAHEFELILFDLDDTLAETAHLTSFRGMSNVNRADPEYLNELKTALSSNSSSSNWECEHLIELKRSGVKLGIVTNAPKAYATTVLDHLFPEVGWDTIVAFEDVGQGHHKPDPEPIQRAMRKCGVTDRHAVAYVGDSRGDLLCAYFAGVSAVLYHKGSRSSDGKRLGVEVDCIPDACIRSMEELQTFINWPGSGLPPLERIPPPREAAMAMVLSPSSPYWATYSPPWGGDPVRVLCLARYFPKEFSSKAPVHRFSRELLHYKDDRTFPSHWPEVLANLLSEISRNKGGEILATVIPSRPGKPPRLEALLDAVRLQVEKVQGQTDSVKFDGAVLQFLHSAPSAADTHQGRNARFENLRSQLSFKGPDDLAGRHLVLIDDVVTSGASLWTASNLLREAGASSVTLVALARTISKATLR